MITFECPACKAKLQVAEEHAGKKIACPGCKATATVPAASDEAVTVAAILPAPPKDAVAPEESRSTAKSRRGGADDDDDDWPRRPDRASSGSAAAGWSVAALLAVIIGAVSCCVCLPIGVALFVPAVQKVREAAARTQSVNNLKQIGLGYHAFHDVNKHLPFNGTKPAVGADASSGSWAFQILPFIDQDPMYRQVLRGLPVSAYLCPGRGRPPLEVTNGGGAWTDYFYNNYLNEPTQAAMPNANDTRRSLVRITDGSSNTVFVGHGNINTIQYSFSGAVTLSTNIFGGGTPGTMRAGNNGKSNPTGVELRRDSNNNPGIGSWGGPFPQGGLMCMGDATVRMFPYNMNNLNVFLTPDGAEQAFLPDF